MSSGWSWFVIGLIVFNLGVTFFLFLWAPRAEVPVLADGTTGHAWASGTIREGLHRLPRWWVVASFVMYFSAFGYLALFPGFGNHEGALDWTSEKELNAATVANTAKLEPVMQRLAALDIDAVGADPQGRQLGERLFIDNCAACHGRHGQGNQLLGAPDLGDADWLGGGSAQDVMNSIRNGRTGAMPAWGALGDAAVKGLAQYVLALSGQAHDATAAAAGEAVFKATCIACHGPDGKGNPILGAPNLTDSVGLYGAAEQAIETSIRDGRQGHMPAWNARLSDQEIHVLAGYVHHLSQRGKAATP